MANPNSPNGQRQKWLTCPCVSLQRVLTSLVHGVSRCEIGWFKNSLIGLFVWLYRLDLTDAVETNPYRYRHLNALFTRALRPGTRPFANAHRLVGCPVEGRISQIGYLSAGQLLQAKGRAFALSDLLGGDALQAQIFQDGAFITLYLAPADYHRVHLPITGVLRAMRHIPGTLFSVMPLATRWINNLYARNERLVLHFATPLGPMTLVMVGALNVASFETVWAGIIQPDAQRQIQQWYYPATGNEAIVLQAGMELGRFNLGSTVIVLLSRNAVQWLPELTSTAAVRLGQPLTI